MALSRPSPREHIHSREIRCRGYRRADGLWDIEAVLEDTKTYSFANHDRGGIVSGEPIHRMHIRLTVDDALVVQAAEASTEAAPFSLCGDIAPVFAGLVGLRVGPGWRKAVLARLAGVHGCTHLTDLLIGPVTQTVTQTVGPARSRRQASARPGAKPAVIDTCTPSPRAARWSPANGPSSTWAPSRRKSPSGVRAFPACSCSRKERGHPRGGAADPAIHWPHHWIATPLRGSR